jgi:ribosomal protein L7/L12
VNYDTMSVVKTVRDYTGLSLRDAVDAVEKSDIELKHPCTLVQRKLQ